MNRRTEMALVFLVASMAAAVALGFQNYPTISYKDAGDHLDEIVWVEGRVLKVESAPEGLYLVFNANEKYVRVLIPKANLEAFEGSIPHKYTGKDIKAVGKISKYGYKLILGVNEEKRIRIVEKGAT